MIQCASLVVANIILNVLCAYKIYYLIVTNKLIYYHKQNNTHDIVIVMAMYRDILSTH